MSKFCDLARVILATAIWVCSSGNIEAAANVVVWDTQVILGNNIDLEERTAWKQVPSNLLSLEADPTKAASDPAYYGRDYSFQGNVVVENWSYLVFFNTAGGKVSIYSKAPSIGNQTDSEKAPIPGKVIGDLVPHAPISDKIARVRLLRNTGDEAVLEAIYSRPNGVEFTAVFAFDRSEIVEIQPSKNIHAMRLIGPIDYGVIPDFIGDDLLIGRDYWEESELNLPSENMFLGLLPGEDRMLVMTWPQSEQKLKLGLGKQRDGKRSIESIILESAGQSFFLSTLAAPGIWHREILKSSFLEKKVKIDWQRPFAAKWITQLNEGGVNARFAFRESSGQIWRGVPGMYQYPVWFDGNDAYYHLTKKVMPRGDSIVYFLEGQNTPLSIRTPVDILKATLGRPFSRMLLDDSGRALRSHHRRGSKGVRRACTCGATEVIQAIFQSGQEAENKEIVDEALEDMIYFVERHLERINEYLEFEDSMSEFLREQSQISPQLKPYIDEVAWIVAQIRDEYEVQKENMKTMPYAHELANDTLSLTRKAVPENLERYMKFFKDWRAMGGAQDYLLARCHAITRKFAQEAGYTCIGQPDATGLAEEIRRRCRRVLRNPDGYEIWANY